MNSKTDFVREHFKATFPDRGVIFTETQGINSFIKGGNLHINYEIIGRLSPDELKALIDHEIAHIQNGDIKMNYILLAVWSLLTAFPFTLISIISIILAIGLSFLFFNGFGFFYRHMLRWQEFEADRFSVACNGKNTVFRMLYTVANTDLFKKSFSHPSIAERIDKINGSQV